MSYHRRPLRVKSTIMSSDKPLSDAEQSLRDAANEYHRLPTRGKISVTPTKPQSNQRHQPTDDDIQRRRVRAAGQPNQLGRKELRKAAKDGNRHAVGNRQTRRAQALRQHLADQHHRRRRGHRHRNR